MSRRAFPKGRIAAGVFSAVLLAYSIYYLLFDHFNFGSLCVWLLAACSTGFFLGYFTVLRFLRCPAGKIVLALFICGVLLAVSVLAVILSGQKSNADGQEKALIVLGCAIVGEEPSEDLECRLNTALQYAKENTGCYVVVCGGQGKTEICPEASVMRDWLIVRGVDPQRILTDDTSTSTAENFMNAAALLAEKGITEEDSVVYVTNGFHCYRSLQYAKTAGFTQMHTLAAPLPLGQYFTCYLREIFALLYYWAFNDPAGGFLRNWVGIL